MENLVLITCPKCGYMVNGRLWRCPGCGGSDNNHKTGKSRKSHQEARSIIAALSSRIRKIF